MRTREKDTRFKIIGLAVAAISPLLMVRRDRDSFTSIVGFKKPSPGLASAYSGGGPRLDDLQALAVPSFHMELKWQKIRKIRRRIDLDFHDRFHKLRPLGVDRAL